MKLFEIQSVLAALANTHPLLMRLTLASVELIALVAVTAALVRLLRIRSPRVVYLLWLVALVKPIVSLAIGSPLPVLLFEKPAAVAEMAIETPLGPASPFGADDSFSVLPGEVDYDPQSWAGLDAPDIPFASTVPTTPAGESSVLPEWLANLSLADALLGLWITGVLGMVGWYLVGRIRLWQLTRKSDAPSAELVQLYKAVGRQLRLKHLPRLVVCDSLESPAIAGWLRPVVFVPRWLAEDVDRKKLVWSLRHELTHWKWLDPLALFARDLARSVFFFHPLVWWSGKQMVEAMELACDRAMLSDLDQATEYAEQLYGLLAQIRDRRRAAVAGGLFATRTQVGRRITAILSGAGIGRPQLTALSLGGVLVAAAISLAIGAGFQEAKPPAEETVEAVEVSAAEPLTPLGKKIANFRLQDSLGATHSLDDFQKQKVVVVAFLGTECPLAKLYGPRLAELAREFRPQGVAFVGIDSNRHDSLVEISHYVRSHKIDFPVLKDPGNKVADLFGAQRTPQVFVLNKLRIVRYWGRIDDQFGVGYARAKVNRRYLAVAIEEVLAGKPVTKPTTKPVGCFIGRVPRRVAKGNVTYSKQIARILQKRCIGCHRNGEIAPFSLTSYQDAAGWSETIREVIHDGRMPPWQANPKYGRFSNGAQMPESEKQLIDQWIENGLPQGNAGDLSEPIEYVQGWRIPKPDVVVTMPKPFTLPAKGVVEYQYFTVDPGFKEDKWIRASEIRPGNSSVVHHVVLYVQPPGSSIVNSRGGIGFEMLAAFAPGTPPMVMRDGFAMFVPAGSKLVFQMHYTPNGIVQTDQSKAGFVFADPKTVKKIVRSGLAINYQFKIPPHAENYRVTTKYKFEEDTLLHWLMPHMHFRGKSFQFAAVYPDGNREILLDVPRYDFYWQNVYMLAKPALMPKGTVMHCIAHFDNSADNLVNPDPDAAVRFGLQSWHEMMIGYFVFSPANQDLALPPPQITPTKYDQFEVFFQYDPPGTPKSVYLAGTFNDWKPTGHKMEGPHKDGRFTTRLVLMKNRYEYKFVVDGKIWRADPSNAQQTGYFRNSVLDVEDNK